MARVALETDLDATLDGAAISGLAEATDPLEEMCVGRHWCHEHGNIGAQFGKFEVAQPDKIGRVARWRIENWGAEGACGIREDEASLLTRHVLVPAHAQLS